MIDCKPPASYIQLAKLVSSRVGRREAAGEGDVVNSSQN